MLPRMSSNDQPQSGIVLATTLVMLVLLMLLSFSVIDSALLAQALNRNRLDRWIAQQSAEAALLDAELDIDHAPGKFSRSALFSAQSDLGFIAGCNRGKTNIYQGLCQAQGSAPVPIWHRIQLDEDDAYAVAVTYGRFTGQTMQVGTSPCPAKLPRYLIELIPDRESSEPNNTAYLYRITALGFGTELKTRQIVQSTFRKKSDQPGQSARKAGRLSWRAIPNWQTTPASASAPE